MIIAEIGLNHLGSKEYLSDYLSCLLDSPVDAITLQIREKQFYLNTGFDNLELPLETYGKIAKQVKNSGKKFGMALSDLSLLSFFEDKVDFYKILSKDIGDDEFVDKLINKINKPMFVSTGMSSYSTINCFLDKVKKDKKKNINLIHTKLSNKIEDTNLKAIEKMKTTFELPISFGNHCENLLVVYAALAFEPTSIFLYVKGDRDCNHPDQKHAVPLSNVKQYTANIRQIAKSIGTGFKKKSKNTIKGQK
jgi:N,N'-diacetyllegionaminate synthase